MPCYCWWWWKSWLSTSPPLMNPQCWKQRDGLILLGGMEVQLPYVASALLGGGFPMVFDWSQAGIVKKVFFFFNLFRLPLLSSFAGDSRLFWRYLFCFELIGISGLSASPVPSMGHMR